MFSDTLKLTFIRIIKKANKSILIEFEANQLIFLRSKKQKKLVPDSR